MTTKSRLTIAPVAVLVLLVVLALLAAKRNQLTADEVIIDFARIVRKVEYTIVKHEGATVAAIVLTALFLYVLLSIDADDRQDKATPRAADSSASGAKDFR